MSREQHDQTAIRTHIGAIFVSLELSRSTWQVTSLSPGGGEKMSKHGVDADDVAGLLARFGELKRKAQARTGEAYRIIAIQEAGLDGFWIHRVLEREGVESHVVDAASVAVSRRRRRAKTDRIDGEALVRTLLAFKRGEPRVCAMVRPPTPEDEDRRRVCRERKALIAERVRHVNRIKGLLHSQGVGDFRPLRRDRRRALEALRTGDGRSLGAHMKAQIGRELDRLEMLLDQIAAVEAEREAMLATMDQEQTAARAQTQLASQQARRDAWRRQAAPQARQEAPQGGAGETAPPGPAPAAPPSTIQMLTGLRSVGAEFAATLATELFSRSFDNRRQVGAYAGLAATPWKSGSIDHEQGVSKAGNPRVRTTMVQLAWLWLRHQPASALSRWFQARVANGKGGRKRSIVALARKLLVALWKYVTAGVVIEGALMNNAA